MPRIGHKLSATTAGNAAFQCPSSDFAPSTVRSGTGFAFSSGNSLSNPAKINGSDRTLELCRIHHDERRNGGGSTMSNPRHPSPRHNFDRSRNEIQASWTNDERTLRRHVALERQQALWRMLASAAASGQAAACEAALPAA